MSEETPAAPAQAPSRDYHAIVHAWFNTHLLPKAVMFSPASGDIVDALPALIEALERKD